jgi:flavodoxin
MKRKVVLSLFVFFLLLILIGCGNGKEPVNTNVTKSNNDTLILYFSATGTTKKIAERISTKLGSDIVEIIPKEKYKDEDLDYNSDCRANREQNDSKARPEIKNKIDISKYDTIYLGYPIWWGTNPKIILTLLDSYDFTGKTIIPFCTSGSSGIGQSVADLRKYNKNLTILDGKRFSVNDSDEVIKKFVNDNTNEVDNNMKAIINGKEYEIKLEKNETVNSFIKMLPLQLDMKELNGNEKYAYLDSKLPTNVFNPKRINAGDVMLYGDDCLVIFYKSFDTSYSYTKMGHIDNLPNLGKDNITIKFE